jgi:DNA-binding transcriptional MerR regulator
MTIGEVARRSGVAASAIRYYEKEGLLPRPARTSGQRRYSTEVLEQVALLGYAKRCGFTLAEMRALFDGFRDAAPLGVRMKSPAQRKIAELDALAGRIAAMRASLTNVQSCACADLHECGARLSAKWGGLSRPQPGFRPASSSVPTRAGKPRRA